MNKSLLLCCSIIALVVILAAQADGKKPSILARICNKCEYCKTDPHCDGCKKCGECISGLKTVDRELLEIQKYTIYLFHRKDANFVSKKKTKSPVEKDVGKDATSVKEKTDLDWKVARKLTEG